MKYFLFISTLFVSTFLISQTDEIVTIERNGIETKMKTDSTASYYVMNYRDTIWYNEESTVESYNYMISIEKSHNHCQFSSFDKPMSGFYTIRSAQDDLFNVYKGTLSNGYFVNGTFTRYFNNGVVQLTGQYVNNWKIGIWTVYDNHGNLLYTYKYIEGSNYPVVETIFGPKGEIIEITDEEDETRERLKEGNGKSNVFLEETKKIVVDDYSVTNEMFNDKKAKSSINKLKSGKTISYDKVWFSNDSLGQTLVFELYTDYHRMVTFHFYNNEIPNDLINRMELHSEDGSLALEKQKLKDFDGFLKQSSKISSSYFVSHKKIRLGDIKQKAIDIYGSPDNTSMSNGVEKLEWDFIGDEFDENKIGLKGKPIVKDSFGYHVTMYFKNGKLVGQILHNDIP